MEQLARKLASNIASSLGYDDEKEAVMAYGLTGIIQIFATVMLVLLLGILVGAPIEAMIVCFSASMLRKYSGGAHAATAELCTGISMVYCTLTAVISKFLLLPIYNSILMFVVGFFIYGLSFYIIYRVAPVDSPNKPIRTDKKKKRMRKGSFITLSIYFTSSGFSVHPLDINLFF